MKYTGELQKRLLKIDNVKVLAIDSNFCKVLLTRKLKYRAIIRSIEHKGRYKVSNISVPDIKIDETVCILYVDRLCFQDEKKRKRNAKKKEAAIINNTKEIKSAKKDGRK